MEVTEYTCKLCTTRKLVIKCLERHQYAPELNKIHLSDGTVVNAPGITTIEKAEQYLKEKK